MTETLASLTERVDNHEARITILEKRQDRQGEKLDEISNQIAAMRAEGNARQEIATHSLERLGDRMTDLTRHISEQTGAQKEQNRIAEENVRRWKKTSIVIGVIATILTAIFSTILSSQTWDDYFFSSVHFLHQNTKGS